MGNGDVAPRILHHALDSGEYPDRHPGLFTMEKEALVPTG